MGTLWRYWRPKFQFDTFLNAIYGAKVVVQSFVWKWYLHKGSIYILSAKHNIEIYYVEPKRKLFSDLRYRMQFTGRDYTSRTNAEYNTCSECFGLALLYNNMPNKCEALLLNIIMCGMRGGPCVKNWWILNHRNALKTFCFIV